MTTLDSFDDVGLSLFFSPMLPRCLVFSECWLLMLLVLLPDRDLAAVSLLPLLYVSTADDDVSALLFCLSPHTEGYWLMDSGVGMSGDIHTWRIDPFIVYVRQRLGAVHGFPSHWYEIMFGVVVLLVNFVELPGFCFGLLRVDDFAMVLWNLNCQSKSKSYVPGTEIIL